MFKCCTYLFYLHSSIFLRYWRYSINIKTWKLCWSFLSTNITLSRYIINLLNKKKFTARIHIFPHCKKCWKTIPKFSLITTTYHIDQLNQDREFILACKRRVIQFVYRWVTTIRHPVFEDEAAAEFLEDLAQDLEADGNQLNSLQEEATLMHHVISQLRRWVQPIWIRLRLSTIWDNFL